MESSVILECIVQIEQNVLLIQMCVQQVRQIVSYVLMVHVMHLARRLLSVEMVLFRVQMENEFQKIVMTPRQLIGVIQSE